MHACRLSTYPHVREMLRSIIMTRDKLKGRAPMEIGAVHKGKGKGKNEEKDPATHSDAEVVCYCCHKKGHCKKHCRALERETRRVGTQWSQLLA